MKFATALSIHFNNFLQQESRYQRSKVIFCKSLYAFLFLKIIFLWTVLPDIVKYSPFQFNSLIKQVVYVPLKVAQVEVHLFLILFLIVLVLGLLVRLNYVTAVLIFWLSISLSRLILPVTNGSDLVLNLFLLISIFLPAIPVMKSSSLQGWQKVSSNFAFLLCRVQLALIYLLSGYDKLMSEAWRSGDALYSIVNLEYYINPRVLIPDGESFYLITAWVTILFELGFALFIWVKLFRWTFLIAGILFHLGIIFLLSLPDFGILMILAYSIFIPVGDSKQTASLK